MKLTLVTVCVALLCVGSNAFPEQIERVIGGADRTRSMHAALVLSGTESSKTLVALGEGTIISNRHILTAAHLVDHFNRWYIVYGNVVAKKGRRIVAYTGLTHPKYNQLTRENDIAIIVVPGDKLINTLLGVPAVLPISTDDYKVKNGFVGAAMGYGLKTSTQDTLSEQLSYTELTVKLTCENATITHFCTFDQNRVSNLCRGDTGAGFYHYHNNDNYLLGIASKVPAQCDGSGDVLFTNVRTYIKWISDIIH